MKTINPSKIELLKKTVILSIAGVFAFNTLAPVNAYASTVTPDEMVQQIQKMADEIEEMKNSEGFKDKVKDAKEKSDAFKKADPGHTEEQHDGVVKKANAANAAGKKVNQEIGKMKTKQKRMEKAKKTAVKKLNKRITKLEKDKAKLEKKKTALEKKIAELERKLANAKDDYSKATLKHQISELKKQLAEVESRIKELEKAIETLKKAVQEIEGIKAELPEAVPTNLEASEPKRAEGGDDDKKVSVWEGYERVKDRHVLAARDSDRVGRDIYVSTRTAGTPAHHGSCAV